MARALSSGPGGKDVVLLAPARELMQESSVRLPQPEPAPGLLLPDGTINWGCPCLGGMATGPCGPQFREAFTCFHNSEAEPKGSECYEKFSLMQDCMKEYPELYGRDDDEVPTLPTEPSEPNEPNEPSAPSATAKDTPAPAPIPAAT